MNKTMTLSIKTTSACNRHCPDCLVLKWMQQKSNYHMTLEQIKELIYFTKESGYRWDRIILSGGDPLLWQNIVEGGRLLKESHIADFIILYTNALAATDENLQKISKIVKNVSEFRISRYEGNEENIKLMQQHFPHYTRVVDKTKFYPLPTIEEMKPHKLLPADCTCRGYSMVGNEIDLCSPPRFIVKNMGILQSRSVYTIPLQMNYLDAFKGKDCFNQIYCRFCLSNRKVKEKLTPRENIANGHN